MIFANRAGLVFTFFCCLCLVSCESNTRRPEMLVGETMGTTYSIKFIPQPSSNVPQNLAQDISDLLVKINSIMSTYDPNSELSIFNQNKSTECIAVSEELAFVIKHANDISEITQGSFDITVGPLVDLWGFGPSGIPLTIPDDEQLHSVLSNIGYEKVMLNESDSCVKKQHQDIYVDLSAIAKGYAVDKVAELLDVNQIDDYMVEIGGEVKAHGNNINDIPWQIGVEKPVREQRSVQKIIALQNSGLATSGDYRNYFEHEGERYSHLIDTKTGKPIRHNVVSVTVLHESTMIADALATAFIVKGHQQGLEIADKENLAVLFIIKKGDEFLEITSDLFNNLTKH